MSPHEQEQLLLRISILGGFHFLHMMRFVAGITKFEGLSKKVVKQAILGQRLAAILTYYMSVRMWAFWTKSLQFL